MRHPKCPNCKSKNVASILWGLPFFNKELEDCLSDGSVVLGGCCVSENDPKWECHYCSHRW